MDSSWDNSAKASSKKGLSPLTTLAIGSGLGFLLLLLAALGYGGWTIHKANQSRTIALERTWSVLHEDLIRIRTEAGARAFYRENPGLADRYASEAEFLQASAAWAAGLKELPEKAPDALGTEGLEFTYNQRGGTNTYLSYRLPHRGGVLRFAVQEGRVVGLSVD